MLLLRHHVVLHQLNCLPEGVVVLLQRLKEEVLVEAPRFRDGAHAATEEGVQLVPFVLLARRNHLAVYVNLVALREVIFDHHGLAGDYLEQTLASEIPLISVNSFHELAVALLQYCDRSVDAVLLADVEAGTNLEVAFLHEVLEELLVNQLRLLIFLLRQLHAAQGIALLE